MTYSCCDFTDDILNALKIEVPEAAWDDPSAQADWALAAIYKLQEDRGRLLKALKGIAAQDEFTGAVPGTPLGQAYAILNNLREIAKAEDGK